MYKYHVEGTRDIPFEELRGIELVKRTVLDKMTSYGYKQIDTPNFENYDLYTDIGILPRKEMVKTLDNEGRVLVLRPDATLPIAKMAANKYKDPSEILKYSYVTTIFREYANRLGIGKDFQQAGVEYLGNASPVCDAEVISLALEIASSLGFRNLHIDIGDVGYAQAFLQGLGVGETETHRIFDLVEQKNLGDLRRYTKELGIPKTYYDILMKLPKLFGPYEEVIEKAESYCINDGMKTALGNMKAIYELLCVYDSCEGIQLDLGFTNQLNYYSNMIFKIYAGAAYVPIVTGGRYDTLSKHFGVDRPACGFGINLSLISEFFDEVEEERASFDFIVFYQKDIPGCLKLVHRLRKDGYSVELSPEGRRFEEKQYRIALREAGSSFDAERLQEEPDGNWRRILEEVQNELS